MLEQLGHTVTVLSQTASEPAASTYGLAVISESVTSGTVGTKFKSSVKPVLSTEPFILDDHDLASTPITPSTSTTAWISDATHPGANGLAAGSVTTHTSSAALNLASASGVDNDARVYLLTANGGNPAAFTVDAGKTVLNGDVTDGPRGFFGPANPTSGTNWTAATTGMFKALVTDLLGGGLVAPTAISVRSPIGRVRRIGASRTVTATSSAPPTRPGCSPRCQQPTSLA
jgi:hypothetical protein